MLVLSPWPWTWTVDTGPQNHQNPDPRIAWFQSAVGGHSYFVFLRKRTFLFAFITLILPLDSICRKVTAEIILSVSGEISLRNETNPTFLHLEIHMTTSKQFTFLSIFIFSNCSGRLGLEGDPINQKMFLSIFPILHSFKGIFYEKKITRKWQFRVSKMDVPKRCQNCKNQIVIRDQYKYEVQQIHTCKGKWFIDLIHDMHKVS